MLNVKHLYLGMKVWDTVYGECTIRDITDTNNEATSYFRADVDDCDLDTCLTVDLNGKVFEIQDKYESFDSHSEVIRRSVYFSPVTITGAEQPPVPPFKAKFKPGESIIAEHISGMIFRVIVIKENEDTMIARPVEADNLKECTYSKELYKFFRIEL